MFQLSEIITLCFSRKELLFSVKVFEYLGVSDFGVDMTSKGSETANSGSFSANASKERFTASTVKCMKTTDPQATQLSISTTLQMQAKERTRKTTSLKMNKGKKATWKIKIRDYEKHCWAE